MDTTLHSANLTVSELDAARAAGAEEEAEHHIHLPNPSLWPLFLSLAIIVTLAGLLFIPANPWISLVGAPFILLGILGWGLEDPMAPHYDASSIRPDLTEHDVLEMAREIVDRMVTISSTAYSAHPVSVEIDNVDGHAITLALYGKVELEAQRDAIEAELRKLPNVVEVRNFMVAEDAILHLANERIAKLAVAGKLDGTRNISVLIENYILHLYGEVSKAETKYMLERELLGIPGVRVVVNHIGIDKDIPGNLGKTRNR
jgi:osmotically-inducible protein OsmY